MAAEDLHPATTSPRVWRVCLGILCVLLGAPALVHAGDLSDTPFGLRLTLALDRGSAYSDVVGLSASTGYPYSSSVNPAATDFLREPPDDFTFAGTLTGNVVSFTGGMTATAEAVSGSWRPVSVGTLIGSYTRIDTHDARTHQGDRLVFQANEVRLSYGHRLIKSLALGVGLRLTESTLDFDSTAFDFPLRTETESLGVEGQAGVLFSPARGWFLGTSVSLGWTRSHTRGSIEFPPPPDAEGPLPVIFTDNTRSVNVRAGVGWQPTEKIGAYIDGQYFFLRTVLKGSPDTSVEVGRGLAGFEYFPVPALGFRIGGIVDTTQQLSLSVGMSASPTKWLQLQLAYVYNAFPEIRKEFGRAHRVAVSIAGLF